MVYFFPLKQPDAYSVQRTNRGMIATKGGGLLADRAKKS